MSISGGDSVTIPDNVKKTIQSIREITGKQHSDEDVYSVLQDCSMDPDDTAQKLLYLGIFLCPCIRLLFLCFICSRIKVWWVCFTVFLAFMICFGYYCKGCDWLRRKGGKERVLALVCVTLIVGRIKPWTWDYSFSGFVCCKSVLGCATVVYFHRLSEQAKSTLYSFLGFAGFRVFFLN